MNNDTISRQAAIDALYHVDEYNGRSVETIKNLPSAEPHWIPVTERLPKPNETVGRVLKHYLVQDIYGDMLVGIWDGVNWQMSCSIEVIDDVVAWMPLPKPYKEGE